MVFLNDKISIRQLQILLILNIFSTGVLTLPRRAAVFANVDGYISVLIAVFIAAFLSLVVTTVASRYENDSFFDCSVCHDFCTAFCFCTQDYNTIA